MLDTLHDFTKTETRVSVNDLRRFSQEWLLDCDLRQHSIDTIEDYKAGLEKIFWFFQHRNFVAVGTSELKSFVSYLAIGHNEPGGRWGNAALKKPLSKASMHHYMRTLSVFFNWLEKEEILDFNPMKKVRPIVIRHEIKQPISDEHVIALLKASRSSNHSKRNEAILLVLMDTCQVPGGCEQQFNNEEGSLRKISGCFWCHWQTAS